MKFRFPGSLIDMFYNRKAHCVLWIFVLLLAVASCSSSDDSDEPMDDEEMTESTPTAGDIVVGGSPWIYDFYELIEVVDRGDSELTDEDLIADIDMEFSDVEIFFFASGGGSETGFDGPASTFNWRLGSNGEIEFTDQFGNPIEPPGEFEVVDDNSISFEFELMTLDQDIDFEVIHRGKAFLKPSE